MKVLALAGYDSFLNTVRLIAPYFEAQHCNVDFALVKARSKKQITRQQVRGLGFDDSLPRIDIEAFCKSGRVKDYDIILSSLEGLSSRKLFYHTSQLENARPLIISVYPGLVLRFPYDGFSMRTSADLLWLNCQRDLRMYTQMCEAFDIDAGNARLFGNASLLHEIKRQPAASEKGPIVFFEQAVIPRYEEERRFLVDQLANLARRYPHREVLIKARAPGKQATLHRTWHPIEDLIEEMSQSSRGQPQNLKLTNKRAGDLLAECSLCLTVSSTVAIEAIHAGVPTFIVRDFGAHDDYGLNYFYGSGLLAPLSDIRLDNARAPNANWSADHWEDPTGHMDRLVSEALSMVRKPRRSYDARAEFSVDFQADLESKIGILNLLNRKYKSKTGLIEVSLKRLSHLLSSVRSKSRNK